MLYSRTHFAVRHAAGGGSRPELNGIHFRADGSTEATNSHMLIRATVDVPPDSEHPKGSGETKPEPFTLPLDAAERILKWMPKRHSMPICTYAVLDAEYTNANGSARLISTDLEQAVVTEAEKLGDGFPNTDQLMEAARRNDKPAFAINLQLIDRFSRAARELKSSRNAVIAKVYFTDDNSPIRFVVTDPDAGELEALIMPMRV